MNEMEMMQLSRLLNAMVGEPPHRVTVGAVRRKVVMRRLIAGVTATAAAAFAVSAGLVISAHALGKHPAATARSHITEPRYYYEAGLAVRGPRSGHNEYVVRSTATGAVTARRPCPSSARSFMPLAAVAAAGRETFFIACLQARPKGFRATGTRLYRFTLTHSGRVTGFGPVAGGNLPGLYGGALAASPDGAELAVAVEPARSVSIHGYGPLHLSGVLVINTRTGKHAVWHTARLPGGIRFNAQDLSFARDARVLAVFGWWCPKAAAEGFCKSPSGAMVAVSHPAAGGRLANGRVLFTRSSLTPDRHWQISDAFIASDGTTATAVVSASLGSTGSTIERVNTATGKPSGVLYRSRHNLAISTDQSGRFVLVSETDLNGFLFGWINHGKLTPLKPPNEEITNVAW